MLISFTLSNWRSFKNRMTFSLEASRERRRSESLATTAPMYRSLKVLPFAAVYGPNSSGKTTLISALEFVQDLVLFGTKVGQSIAVEPYLFDSQCESKPCEFSFVLLIDGLVYEYDLAVTRKEIVKEGLAVRRSRAKELLFSRTKDGGIALGSGHDTERNRFVAEGTRPNQPFLLNSVEQNVTDFAAVYGWFFYSLRTIGVEPGYRSRSTLLLRRDFRDFVNNMLQRYNTGAYEVELRDVAIESVPFLAGEKEGLLRSVPAEGDAITQYRVNYENGGIDIFILTSHDGAVNAQRVQLRHRTSDESSVTLELSEESRGTQRLLELLPIFFDLAAAGEESLTYVVDEFNQGLHTRVAADLIATYLETCSASSHHQLIISTHDLLLMEERFLRRDELWICENSPTEGSSLCCVGTHPDVRTDTDILNAYRRGVFGGYPEFYEGSGGPSVENVEVDS